MHAHKSQQQQQQQPPQQRQHDVTAEQQQQQGATAEPKQQQVGAEPQQQQQQQQEMQLSAETAAMLAAAAAAMASSRALTGVLPYSPGVPTAAAAAGVTSDTAAAAAAAGVTSDTAAVETTAADPSGCRQSGGAASGVTAAADTDAAEQPSAAAAAAAAAGEEVDGWCVGSSPVSCGEVAGGVWVRVFTEEYRSKRGDYTRRFLAASYAVGGGLGAGTLQLCGTTQYGMSRYDTSTVQYSTAPVRATPTLTWSTQRRHTNLLTTSLPLPPPKHHTPTCSRSAHSSPLLLPHAVCDRPCTSVTCPPTRHSGTYTK